MRRSEQLGAKVALQSASRLLASDVKIAGIGGVEVRRWCTCRATVCQGGPCSWRQDCRHRRSLSRRRPTLRHLGAASMVHFPRNWDDGRPGTGVVGGSRVVNGCSVAGLDDGSRMVWVPGCAPATRVTGSVSSGRSSGHGRCRWVGLARLRASIAHFSHTGAGSSGHGTIRP